MPYPPSSRPTGRSAPGAAAQPAPASPDWGRITRELAGPKPDFFDGFAKGIAGRLGEHGTDKSHQVRRYYDELSRWNDQVQRDPGAFSRLEPFIRMMNAKVAYAAGRGNLVSANFQEFFTAGLRGVKDSGTLDNFKLLFEAVIGFQKG